MQRTDWFHQLALFLQAPLPISSRARTYFYNTIIAIGFLGSLDLLSFAVLMPRGELGLITGIIAPPLKLVTGNDTYAAIFLLQIVFFLFTFQGPFWLVYGLRARRLNAQKEMELVFGNFRVMNTLLCIAFVINLIVSFRYIFL